MSAQEDRIRVISWNVNGIRACVRKGFVHWLKQSEATIIGLQEVRALEKDLPDELLQVEGWERHLFPAERLGYSGVGILTRIAAKSVKTGVSEERFDCEGRLQIARFGRARRR